MAELADAAALKAAGLLARVGSIPTTAIGERTDMSAGVSTKLARVEYRQGVPWLIVADLLVVKQGDPLHDPRIVYGPGQSNVWSKESLEHAADWINVRTRGGSGPVSLPGDGMR